MKKVSLLLAGLLACTLPAQAIVTFSLVGEVVAREGGTAYTVGESVTLTYISSADLGVPNQTNSTSTVDWLGNVSPFPVIWNDIILSGTTGTYTPADSGQLFSKDTSDLLLAVNNASNTSIGLSVDGEAILQIYASVIPSGTYARYPGDDSTSPETVFYNGTYDVTNKDVGSIETDFTSFYYVEFSSLTITGALVPEPSEYALGLGVVVLLGVLVRRKYRC